MNSSRVSWPTSKALSGARLDLEPLCIEHADEMAPLLNDVALHVYIAGRPSTRQELAARYRRQVRGRSPDGSQCWLNWVMRRRADARAIGTMQATLTCEPPGVIAEVAWVVAVPFQRQGYAGEGGLVVLAWLRHQGVAVVRANVHPDHDASRRVARALGLRPTDIEVDGETRWQADERR